MCQQQIEDIAFQLWGKTKPFHPLISHMIDVGCVAGVLLDMPGMTGVLTRWCAATGCPRSIAISWLAFLVALHDVGKCHPDFEGKAPDLTLMACLAEKKLLRQEPLVGFRHEAFAHTWIANYLRRERKWHRKPADTVATSIHGHHGDFNSGPGLPEEDCLAVFWKPLRQILTETLIELFAPDDWAPVEFADSSTAGILLTGLVVLSDWIASNPEIYTAPAEQVGSKAYFRAALLIAERTLKDLGFDDVVSWPDQASFRDIWHSGEFQQVRPMQQVVQELCLNGLPPGLVIIEAPMGEGKTEASLYLATQWLATGNQGGIYLALPTAATSNQMHERVRSFLTMHGAGRVELIHGMSWLVDDRSLSRGPELAGDEGEADLARDWFRPKKRALLAPYGVGTVDQAMMSVLHVHHGFLRLFGLSGKVLIIDEVHAYDTYMTRIIHRLLAWCGALQIPVIILSATLPGRKRQELLQAYGAALGESQDETSHDIAAYPLLTAATPGGEIRTVPLPAAGRQKTVQLVMHPGLLSDAGDKGKIAEDVARMALKMDGACSCVILNTVHQAQEVYHHIKDLLDDDTVLMLFHSRFRAERRQEIEQDVLDRFGKKSLLPKDDPDYRERTGKAILVATQVVEQSLDLDFDAMTSELAPIDLILQRLGRLHRHERPLRPVNEAVLHLLLPESQQPDLGRSGHVYEPFLLLRTLAILTGRDRIVLPEDIRSLVESVYNDQVQIPPGCMGITGEMLEETYQKMLKRQAEEEQKALRCLIPKPDPQYFTLGRIKELPFDEGDGLAASYLHASTRLGDDSRQVLFLEGDSWMDELSRRYPPDRKALRLIMLQLASIPGWWLQGSEARPGYESPARAPHWLPGIMVLRTREGVWRGRDRQDRAVLIRDDRELGLVYEKESD
jgi:CRISPR-associated endonuclease/helicase Cas3